MVKDRFQILKQLPLTTKATKPVDESFSWWCECPSEKTILIFEKTGKMNKFLRLFQTVAVITTCLCLLFLWVIGTFITVQIDSSRASEYHWMEIKVQNVSSHIDKYCAKLERKRLLENDVQNLLRKNRNRSQAEEDKEMQARLKEQTLRNNILHHALVYVKDLEQMWCLVPKAASTSWSKALLEHVNQRTTRKIILYNEENAKQNITPTPLQMVLKAAYKYKNPVYETALKSDSVKKILLIRHPFERLVSAYEDKLKDRTAKSDSLFFFRAYGFKISRKFRKRGPKALKQREPTFEEFIEYLLRTDPLHYDEHWQPITLLCDLCHIKYDYVIRQEELAEMSSFHLAQLGFPSTYLMSRRNQMLSDGMPNNFSMYYKNISRPKMIQLFQKYQDDFNLFNYKFFDYYSAGQ